MTTELDRDPDETRLIRAAVGRLGDRALPAPDFDHLHLRAVDERPAGAGPSWPRRLAPVAALASITVVVGIAVGIAGTGGDGDSVEAGGTEPTIASETADSGEDPDQPDTGSPSSTPPGDETRPDPAATGQAIGVGTVVVASDGTVTIHRGGAVPATVDGFGDNAWSDGRFVYGWSAEGSEWLAATMDGTIVCRDRRSIHHVTERADGTFVMAVEQEETPGTPPAVAVDCATGDEQPIEPFRRFGDDGEFVVVHRVADRVFEARGDAEGNLSALTDESGRDLIGDAYLGLTEFRADGRLLAFGDQRGGPSPHVTRKVGVQDLDAGERLWDRELDGYVTGLWFVDDRLVIGTMDEDPVISGETEHDRLLVVDARTGETLGEAAAPAGLVFVG